MSSGTRLTPFEVGQIKAHLHHGLTATDIIKIVPTLVHGAGIMVHPGHGHFLAPQRRQPPSCRSQATPPPARRRRLLPHVGARRRHHPLSTSAAVRRRPFPPPTPAGQLVCQHTHFPMSAVADSSGHLIYECMQIIILPRKTTPFCEKKLSLNCIERD